MEGRDAKARNLWGTSAAPLLPQGGAPSYSRRDRPWFDHRSDSCISARLHPNSSGRGYECSKNSASTMCGSGTQGCPGVRPEFLPLQNLPVLAGVRGIRSLSRSDVRWSREVAARPARPAANLRSSSPTPGYLLTTTPELAATLMRPHLASRTGGLCEPSVRSSLRTFDFAADLERMSDSARGQDELATSWLPEWLDQPPVTGTPADCACSIGRLASAGADRIVLVPPLDRIDEQARILGEEGLAAAPVLSGQDVDARCNAMRD